MQFTSIKAGIGDLWFPLRHQRRGKLVVAAAALVSGRSIVGRTEDLSMVRDFLPCRRASLLPSVDLQPIFGHPYLADAWGETIARNQIKGTIVNVQKGATTAHVRVDIGGGVIITSSITNEPFAINANCHWFWHGTETRPREHPSNDAHPAVLASLLTAFPWRKRTRQPPGRCASPWKAFWRVGLPLAGPGILSGAVLCFANIVRIGGPDDLRR